MELLGYERRFSQTLMYQLNFLQLKSQPYFGIQNTNC